MAEHILQNKAIQLIECTSPKSEEDGKKTLTLLLTSNSYQHSL